MAWMRPMGLKQVAYHRDTIIHRADDHPGQALAYYASRGETPLVWSGDGAERLGLVGAVTDAQYDFVFGPGGARDPTTGEQLVHSKRPGIELVISAHKSVAELGVIGRAEDMHRIMDAERDATIRYLEDVTQAMGGRRGRAATPTPTSGLIYATARHATSRAGDPNPHDHVLLANVLEMRDDQGGYKAAHTTLWRDHLHAATIVGRMAAAYEAVQLGYGIVPDDGPSGKLGHWAIAGVPKEVQEVHSKRAAEIQAEVDERGFSTYQARGVAARETRNAKRHTPVDELLAHWRSELERVGYPIHALEASITEAAERYRRPSRSADFSVGWATEKFLDPDGELAAQKVFFRRDVVVAVGPTLYGHRPKELDRFVDAVLRDPEAVPLLRVPGASEQPYTTAATIARENAIAERVAEGMARTNAAACTYDSVSDAAAAAEKRIGAPRTMAQRVAADDICTSGRGVDLIVGVAGSGKTTVLGAVRDAYEGEGFEVTGTATSGQAARTLGAGAGIDPSRTVASLLWRLDHRTMALGERSVVILDEAGMTADRDMLRLLSYADAAGAKVVMVGDHRQLGAVGPGGALEALITRHGGVVHTLSDNVRQREPAEREALAELRAGSVENALDFYEAEDRIHTAPSRAEALEATVAAWAKDVAAGRDAGMFAWRRANVEALNRLGREAWMEAGHLKGPELEAPGGRRYQAGDRIVTLAPAPDGRLVTSERGVVTSVDAEAGTLRARMADGRLARFEREDSAADRLGYGYALTVHRSQGATTDVSHRYADGGGRELAYVAMSRARGPSYVYAVADDVAQAKDDLARDWSTEARQRWVLDTNAPAQTRDQERPAERIDAARRLQRLEAEREAVRSAGPADNRVEVGHLERERQGLLKDREELRFGDGPLRQTEAGRVASALRRAEHEERRHAEWARQAFQPRSVKRHNAKDARRWGKERAELEKAWDRVGKPVAAKLDREIAAVDKKLDTTRAKQQEREDWLERHPEVRRRLGHLDRSISELRNEAYKERSIALGIRNRALERDANRGLAIERSLEIPGP